MTTGANAPSNELLAPEPIPEYFPIALSSAVWSRLPRSDESIFVPRSATDCPAAPTIPGNLSSVLISCFAASASFCGPPGLAATPAKAANSAGTPAATAEDASLRSRPSALAMRPIMSGVRNFMMTDTRFVAMPWFSRIRD
jgi:hypothetical protein